jgi:ParB family transcriptional regulator, chromosome partitioning protein
MSKINLNAETFTVPLDKLVRDEANVRQTDRDADVAALADNIAHEGLLQNLGVRAVLNDSGEPSGRYGVAIGGRRLAALKLLVKTKRLAKNAPIACALVAADAVTSAGLAENQHRIAMHPADGYAAFAKMADDGLSENDIAVRFGISAVTVQKRLRLGRLSPRLLDALRSNSITNEVAQAFAITTDHDAQERVYAQLAEGRWIEPHVVRKMLTEGEVPGHDRRVLFVGLDTYEQAGGEVRRDLFSEGPNGTTLLDPALLDRLVMEKLTSEADRLRAEGWQSVAVSTMTPDDTRAFYAAPFERSALSQEAEAQITAKGDELDALSAKSEAEGLTDEEEDRATEIEAEIEAIQSQAYRYSDETKAAGKAFVYLEHNGLQVFHALPRAGLTPGNGDADADGLDDDAPARSVAAEKPAFSASLTVDLQAQRTAALQAQVAERPDLALRLVVQSLLLARGHGGYRSVAKITPNEPYLKQACPTIEDSKAHRLLTNLHDNQDHHTPGEHAEILPWLLELSDSEVLTVLAPLVASTVSAGTEDWSRGMGLSLEAQAAQAADLDMREYWEANSETYFRRVSKAQIAQAVTEAGAGPFSVDGKKAEVAAAATRLTNGSGWLPSLLRMPPPENDADNDDTAEPLSRAAE